MSANYVIHQGITKVAGKMIGVHDIKLLNVICYCKRPSKPAFAKKFVEILSQLLKENCIIIRNE